MPSAAQAVYRRVQGGGGISSMPNAARAQMTVSQPVSNQGSDDSIPASTYPLRSFSSL